MNNPFRSLCKKINAKIICEDQINNVRNLGKKINKEKNKTFFLVYLDKEDMKLVLLKSKTQIKYYLSLARKKERIKVLGVAVVTIM